MFTDFCAFVNSVGAPTHPLRVQNIAGKVKDLQQANYQTLKLLIQHLRK